MKHTIQKSMNLPIHKYRWSLYDDVAGWPVDQLLMDPSTKSARFLHRSKPVQSWQLSLAARHELAHFILERPVSQTRRDIEDLRQPAPITVVDPGQLLERVQTRAALQRLSEENHRLRMEKEWLRQENHGLRREIGLLKATDGSRSAGLPSNSAAAEHIIVHGLQLPAAWAELATAIDDSRSIVDLPDNWDGEGSTGYDNATWLRAMRYIVDGSVEFWRSHRIVPPVPSITPGPDGSIDIVWQSGQRRLFLNVPDEPQNIVTFYGKDRSNEHDFIQGEGDLARDSEGVLAWLIK